MSRLSLLCLVWLLLLQAEVEVLTRAQVILPVTVFAHLKVGTAGRGRKGHVLNARAGVGEDRKHFPKPVRRVQILVYAGWNTVASPCLMNMMTATVRTTRSGMLREVERVVRGEKGCLLLT